MTPTAGQKVPAQPQNFNSSPAQQQVNTVDAANQ